MDIESLGVKGTSYLIEEEQKALNASLEVKGSDESFDSLASFISSEYQRCKDSRQASGIEEEMFNSLRAFNGEYNPADLSTIQATGGSSIFMHITATKCRAAAAWIKDILLGKELAYAIEPTPKPSLPEDIIKLIEDGIKRQIQTTKQQETPGQPVEQANNAFMPPQPQEPAPIKEVQENISKQNQLERDIKDAIMEEINLEARHGIKQLELMIKDQLTEGRFNEALSDFIEDFTIFPIAIMKGPITTFKKSLTWVNGKPELQENLSSLNKRVSPFDFYPAPEATSVNGGTIIEHIRITPSELASFIDKDDAGYKTDVIKEILENTDASVSVDSTYVDEGVEQDESDLTFSGTSSDKRNIFHGLHFFGHVPADQLDEWGIRVEKGIYTVDVEAILLSGKVIKCVINDDPLNRKPYYTASWQKIPGAIWGISLPKLMSDIQRLCNATARALANNMGLSAGPQIQVYIDRLADDSPIDEIKPFKIWQLTSDPTGSNGRAIEFTQPTSNANELLAVYNQFEQKADEATGIPRYMYSGDQGGNASGTAAGLSMLMDSATKTIKEAIRHIDEGLIKPRVEYQFYWNMLKKPIEWFSGDVQIVAKGSSALTVKGAAQLRRNEFLQVTANPFDMAIMGKNGRADILREMAKDLDLTSNIVPSRLVLQKLEEEEKAMQAQAMQTEQDKGLAATKLQIDGQMQMAQGAQTLKAQEIVDRKEIASAKFQQENQRIAQNQEATIAKLQTDLQKVQMQLEQKDMANKRTSAVQLETSGV